jgi:hypothetical protein
MADRSAHETGPPATARGDNLPLILVFLDERPLTTARHERSIADTGTDRESLGRVWGELLAQHLAVVLDELDPDRKSEVHHPVNRRRLVRPDRSAVEGEIVRSHMRVTREARVSEQVRYGGSTVRMPGTMPTG